MKRRAYTFENVMLEIAEIGKSRNFSSFEILGYSHLKTTVRFHYGDCDEIITIKYQEDEPMTAQSRYIGDWFEDEKGLIDRIRRFKRACDRIEN